MTHESARGLMDVSRFVALGYLQEVNRLFFHPIGLALTVEKQEDGSYRFAQYVQKWEDPEGTIFGSLGEEGKERARVLYGEQLAYAQRRLEGLGIEPIGDPAVDTYYDPEPFAP